MSTLEVSRRTRMSPLTTRHEDHGMDLSLQLTRPTQTQIGQHLVM